MTVKLDLMGPKMHNDDGKIVSDNSPSAGRVDTLAEEEQFRKASSTVTEGSGEDLEFDLDDEIIPVVAVSPKRKPKAFDGQKEGAEEAPAVVNESLTDESAPQVKRNITASAIIEGPELEESQGKAKTESREFGFDAQVEAIVFASQKPIKPHEVLEVLQIETVTTREIQASLQALAKRYQELRGGFRLEYIQGAGYQFRTVHQASYLMERMFSQKARPLSRASMETLSIIAYKQPVTRAEIEYVRGVDAGSIIKTLLERDLIRCVGRKQDSGRPMMFGTTTEFLSVFKLNNLSDLPSLESFQASLDTLRAAREPISKDQVDVEAFISDNDEEDAPQVAEPEALGGVDARNKASSVEDAAELADML